MNVTEKCAIRAEPGSFRDPAAKVFYRGDVVLRGLSSAAWDDWRHVSACDFFRQAQRDGTIVLTREMSPVEQSGLDGCENWAGVLRHECIPFISYPYEWSFGMLRAGALHYLDLLAAALKEGISLKDGTAFNIQWQGVQPVFIDVPSFYPLAPGEPWIGYRQFCQMFLYPLMLTAYRNVRFQAWLRGNLEGIEPRECDALMSVRDWLRPGVFLHVHLHASFDRRLSQSGTSARSALQQAGFSTSLIEANVRRLQQVIRRLTWTVDTEWSGYTKTRPYAAEDHARKIDFVRGVLSQGRWKRIWDLGCNTGEFSKLAAERADYVVALDRDPGTIERLFDDLKRHHVRNVLPLVQDLANPSAATGWNCRERQALAARGGPELTLCLALVHHLALGQNIPLEALVEWLASLGPQLVVEFVDAADPMVQALLRDRRANIHGYTREQFEKQLATRYRVIDHVELARGQRVLYHAILRG